MRTFCPTRAAAVAPGWHLHCRATSMLRHGLHTGAPTDERTTAARLAGVVRRTRRAAHPSRAPTAASPGRSPRLLRLAAAPSPLPTALAAHCPVPTAPVTPALATAAKNIVLAATTTAAETWSTHTAQPARDCQGAGYKARARATEDARPTRSLQRCRAPAGRDADRVDVDTRDRVGDVGSRCGPAGLEEVVE